MSETSPAGAAGPTAGETTGAAAGAAADGTTREGVAAAPPSPPSPSVPRDGRWGGGPAFALATVLLGAVGLVFSFVIMVEKVAMMRDSGFVPSCTFNSVIACGDVMASEQASAFGFPNPIIGLVGFGVVLAVGMGLLAGARFRPWFWWGYALGLVLAVVFVHWLAYQAVYEIVALCPWCMIVWAVVLPLFVMTLVHMARERHRARGEEPERHTVLPVLVVLVWYLGFFALIYQQFGNDLFMAG